MRIAAQLIAYDGRVRFSALRFLARQHGHRGRRVGQIVRDAVAELTNEELVTVDNDQVVADSVPELAAWLADELDDAAPPGGRN